MAFTISGATPMGPVSFRRDTPEAALRKARDLGQLGLRDIRIVDDEGRTWTPEELAGRGASDRCPDDGTCPTR